MGYWTIILGIKSLFWFGFAGAGFSYYPNQPMVAMAYAMTGVVFILVGLLADKCAEFNAPMIEEVLLRHDNKAYLLNIFRTSKGDKYAPRQDSLRVLREVNVSSVPLSTLGCPHFIPKKFGFEVLGRIYSF